MTESMKKKKRSVKEENDGPGAKPAGSRDAGQTASKQSDKNRSSDGTSSETDFTVEELKLELGNSGKIGQTLNSTMYYLNQADWRREHGLGTVISPDLESILSNISYLLRRLQMSFPDSGFACAKSAEEHILDVYSKNEFDPVFAEVIASRRGLPKLHEKVEDRAFEAYAKYSEEYDLVLRDLIPESLKTETADAIARQKYLSGTYATARGDWRAFLANSDPPFLAFTTGLPQLDEALGGGISRLTMIGANEGDGKTSLMLNIIVSALRADEDLDCLIYTIDQSKNATLSQLRSLATGCDRRTLDLPATDRSAAVNRQIKEGIAELEDALLPRIRLIEKSNLSLHEPVTDATFHQHYEKLRYASQATRGMLAIDLFQSMDRFPEKVATDNDRDDFRLEMLRRFMDKNRTEDCPEGIPIIVTSEIRKVERQALTSNDLRGSARLGSFPTNILLLWPPEGTDQHADVVPRVVRVAKSRRGDKSVLRMQFHHKICRFIEMPAAESAAESQASAGGSARSVGLDSRNAL